MLTAYKNADATILRRLSVGKNGIGTYDSPLRRDSHPVVFDSQGKVSKNAKQEKVYSDGSILIEASHFDGSETSIIFIASPAKYYSILSIKASFSLEGKEVLSIQLKETVL